MRQGPGALFFLFQDFKGYFLETSVSHFSQDVKGSSSKQVYCISIRDNFHATSRRRLHMKVFFNSSLECVVVTIDNRFCLQTSKYFSLEFSEEVIRS